METEKINVAAVAPADLLARLARIGVRDWGQVLLCVPKGYLDYSDVKSLGEVLPRTGVLTEPAVFALVVSEAPTIISHPRRRILLTATDGMLSVRVVVFYSGEAEWTPWLALKVGDRMHVRAELQSWGGKLQITGPQRIPDELVGGVCPQYPGRRGVVAEQALFAATRHALRHHLPETVDAIRLSIPSLDEAALIAAARLTYTSLTQLLLDLHAPKDMDAALLAAGEIRKLVAFSVVYNARQMKQRQDNPASRIPLQQADVDALVGMLPMSLTNDQRQAISEVVSDLVSNRPMNRLISGDVGTGKSLVYLIPAIAAQKGGSQVAIMTPNAILAEQLATEAQTFFGQDIPIALVTGANKKPVDFAARPLLIGTTALLSRMKSQGISPALLVVDEQQKFSVQQKTEILDSGCNVAEVTATAIPRTTAIVTHGGMDISILRECPVAKSIQTRIVTSQDAERLYSHTLKVLESGAQVAVIYPIVDDPEQEKRSVASAFDQWSRRFPGKVGMVYGAMKEDQKTEVIRQMKSGELSILVGSTCVEIGVTIPALRSLIVVNAECYGVSTLHQLRGRVARHGGTGYFFLYLPDRVKPEALARLELLERFKDGFSLAEHDANNRGYGDLCVDGERQHGASRSSVFYGIELLPEEIRQFAGVMGD